MAWRALLYISDARLHGCKMAFGGLPNILFKVLSAGGETGIKCENRLVRFLGRLD